MAEPEVGSAYVQEVARVLLLELEGEIIALLVVHKLLDLALLLSLLQVSLLPEPPLQLVLLHGLRMLLITFLTIREGFLRFADQEVH